MEISATLKCICKSKTRKSTLVCKAYNQGKKYNLQGYMFAFAFHKSCWVSHTTESLCGLVTVFSFTFRFFSSRFPWTDAQSRPEQCACRCDTVQMGITTSETFLTGQRSPTHPGERKQPYCSFFL